MSSEKMWKLSIYLLSITWSLFIVKTYDSLLFGLLYYFATTISLLILYDNIKTKVYYINQYKLLLKSIKIPKSKWQT
jgi:hypothetical protein